MIRLAVAAVGVGLGVAAWQGRPPVGGSSGWLWAVVTLFFGASCWWAGRHGRRVGAVAVAAAEARADSAATVNVAIIGAAPVGESGIVAGRALVGSEELRELRGEAGELCAGETSGVLSGWVWRGDEVR